MRLILTALIFLLGMFDLFLATSFLLDPQQAARGLGLLPDGVAGLSTLRAHFAGFFGVIAVSMMLGAWRRNGDLLLVPAALEGVTVLVRAVSLALDGNYPGWQVPLLVELAHVVLLVAAWRVLPHHKIEELTG
jgi:hypothetical protein